MKNKLGISRLKKVTFVIAVVFSMTVVGLALTPHYTCGCGDDVEDGTKLTYVINGISKIVIGKKVFNSNK